MYLEGKKIKGVIYIMGFMVLLLSILKQYIFYSNFGIIIFEYIELSEFLLLTMPDFIKYGSFIFISSILIFVFEDREYMEHLEEIKTDTLKYSMFKMRFKKYFRLFKPFFIFSIGLFVIYVVSFIWFKDFFKLIIQSTLIMPILLVAMIILFEYKYRYYLLFKKRLNSTYFNLILIYIYLFIYIISATYNKVNNIKSQSISISFEFNDENINTGKNVFYLGQTKDYLFIFNSDSSKSTIYDRNKIEKYVIENNKK